ncbi:MAG: thiol-disulfide oxidoreductase [Caldiserica bacterium]|nr:MAG: thiol-disulfide oxidoreductase [Caldisericota bacterium]
MIKRLIIVSLLLVLLISCSAGTESETNKPKLDTSNRKEAPDFTLSTLDGGVISLSELRGKVVLLDFWATWCGPCRRSTPIIVSIYNEYHKRGFVALGINLDRENDMDKVAQYVNENNMDYPILINAFSVAEVYKVTGIPRFVLIDKQGRIVIEIEGLVPDLKAKLEQYIETLLTE